MSEDIDQLRDVLRRSVPDLSGVDFEDLARRAGARQRRSRRSRPVVAVGASILAVAAVAVAVTSFSANPEDDHQRARPAAPIGQDYASLVLHDGDQVEASGRVVAVPGRPVRFCDETSTLLPLRPEKPSIALCELGVDVTGVDLTALTGRVSHGGTIEGTATLTGTWDHGTITVARQRVPPPDTNSGPALTTAPCVAPRGGWPVRTGSFDGGPVYRFERTHPGVVRRFALLHPGPDTDVAYVLTSTDPIPVERALSAALPGGLCVVRTRYTREQLRAATAAFDLGTPVARAAGMNSEGPGQAADGQPQITVGLFRVTPAVARLAAAQPRGLVELYPWLSPCILPRPRSAHRGGSVHRGIRLPRASTSQWAGGPTR